MRIWRLGAAILLSYSLNASADVPLPPDVQPTEPQPGDTLQPEPPPPPLPPAPKAAKKKKKRKKKETVKSFSARVSARHGAVFEGGSYPISTGSLSLTYQPSAKRVFNLSQSAVKYYRVDPGEREVYAQDTVLAHGYDFTPESFILTWDAYLTLPVSEYSRFIGRQSETGTALNIGKAFGDGVFTVTAGPRVAYYINKYKTAPTDFGGSGSLLPQYSYGAGASMNLTLFDIWTTGIEGGYDAVMYEKSKYTNNDELKETALPDHYYNAVFSTGLNFGHFSISAGVIQQSAIEAYGGVEYVLFDQATTQWFVSLSAGI